MWQRNQLFEGMTVRLPSGEKLGKIEGATDRSIEVAKGVLFKDHFQVPFDDVISVENDELIVSSTYAGHQEGYDTSTAAGTSGEEFRSIPLKEEELYAEKREKGAGELRIKKDVEVEKRTISVPVTKERVHVERADVNRELSPGEASFEEEEIRIPLKEEEVEIRKRPVVREEVRVATSRDTETRTFEDELRKEKARIDPSGEVRKVDDDPERGRY